MKFLIFLLIFNLLGGSVHASDMKCPEMPSDITKVTRDVKSAVDVNVGKLGKVSAGQVAVKTDVAANAIFRDFPNVDKLVVLQMLASSYCSALNTSGINGRERLDRWERFIERQSVLEVKAKNEMRGQTGKSDRVGSKIVNKTQLSAAAKTDEIVSSRYQSAMKLCSTGNYGEGFKILKDLADHGHVYSQYQVARAYLIGEGVLQSYNDAFIWMKRSAQGRYPVAQHNLAVMYQDGLGTSKDQNQANIWFSEAARGGYAPSQDLLTRLGVTW